MQTRDVQQRKPKSMQGTALAHTLELRSNRTAVRSNLRSLRRPVRRRAYESCGSLVRRP